MVDINDAIENGDEGKDSDFEHGQKQPSEEMRKLLDGLPTPGDEEEPQAQKEQEDSSLGNGYTDLVCGVYNHQGKICHRVYMKKFKGSTRKKIGTPANRSNPAKALNVLLKDGIDLIEGFEGDINDNLLNRMLIGDRDFLALNIRRHSLSTDEMKISYRCEACGHKDVIDIHTDDLPIDSFSMDGIKESGEGLSTYRYTERDLSDSGGPSSVKFRFPDGEVQVKVSPLMRKNPIEGAHHMYASLIIEWDGKKGVATPKFFDGLDISIIDHIDSIISEMTFGPNMTIEGTCGNCGADMEGRISVADFLSGSRARS